MRLRSRSIPTVLSDALCHGLLAKIAGILRLRIGCACRGLLRMKGARARESRPGADSSRDEPALRNDKPERVPVAPDTCPRRIVPFGASLYFPAIGADSRTAQATPVSIPNSRLISAGSQC